jgi:hypothetical protein
MHPWKLGSKYVKYKLKPLRPDTFWANGAVCSVVTNWFAAGTLVLLGLHWFSFIRLKTSDSYIT